MKKSFWAAALSVILCLLTVAGCALSTDVDEEQIYRVGVEIMAVEEEGIWVRALESQLFEEAFLESTQKTAWRSARGERISKDDFEAGDEAEVLILPPVRKGSQVYATLLEADKRKGQKEMGEYQRITPQEAKAMMQKGEAVILDVRTEEEYDQGHIENSLLLPYDEIGQKAEGMLSDKDTPILVYCRSGQRSKAAAKSLLQLGYSEVYDFGGLMDWPYGTVQ